MNRISGVIGFAVLLAVLAVPCLAANDMDVPKNTRWIWYPEGDPARSAPVAARQFRGIVTLPAANEVKSVQLIMTADDNAVIHVNGAKAADKTSGHSQIEMFDITAHVKPGRNVLAIEVHNMASAAGLLAWVMVYNGKDTSVLLVTDGSWKAAKDAPAGWQGKDFDDSTWVAAKVLGPYGMAPWTKGMAHPAEGMPLPEQAPPERPLTPEKAQKLIEADWVHQANYKIDAAASLKEIGYARDLAARLTKIPSTKDASPSAAAEGFKKELAELDALEAKVKALPADADANANRPVYFAVRAVKRRIMFANPLLDFDKIILQDVMPYNGQHESAHRNGQYYHADRLGRLVVLEGLKPDAVERNLVPPESGYFMRMDLSFDASRLVFAMKPRNEGSFHLYEVGVDGKNLRQLTNSPYDDMDPIYLPDGHILFSSSRGNSYVRCLPNSQSTVLTRCDANGQNIYIISRNSEPDYTPTLLPDGRVLYTRWEYTERPLWRLQKLWTINPDGTGEAVYWGNASGHPDVMWEARPIPGTNKVMFAGVGHHNVITGTIGIIDVSQGLEYPKGIAKVTGERDWTEVGSPGGAEMNPVASPTYHAAGFVSSYRCPFPLGAEDFLVSASRSQHGKFDLFLMDIHGNRELIYTGRNNSWYAQPLRARTAPEIRTDRVAWPAAGQEPRDGVLYSSNVYQGVDGLPEGKARFLRVIQMDAKTYSMGFKSWRHSGPAISVIQEDGVKRILGTVPIQPDGSVSFRVPSGRALHFQLLDENQRCLQVMRSFTGVMPGESRGCLGCHGLQNNAPETPSGKPSAMALRPPADLTPPPWGANVSVSYERFCQPVLDKYCGKCHQGEGKARATLDLTLRGGVAEKGISDPNLLPFKEPYLTLVGHAWTSPINDVKNAPGLGFAGCLNVEMIHTYGPIKPMTMLSSTSPLIERAMSGKHHGVKIEGEDLLKLIAWVDCNCVYRGDEEVRKIPDPRDSRWPVPARIASAPVIDRLKPVTDPPVGAKP